MYNKKKIPWKRTALIFTLCTLMSLAFVFALAGCGGSQDTPVVEEDPEETEAGLKIIIVTSGSNVDDGSFNQNNYEGILDFIKNNPEATVNTTQSTDIADSMNDVDSVLADYDVIVLPGFQFASVSTRAVDNPEKYFILVDTDPAPVDDQTVFDNIYAMTFKEQESGFFAGIAAALETQTGKVAFVGGMAFPPVVNYQFGFEAGVNYANLNLGTDVKLVNVAAYAGTDVTNTNVGGNYVQDFGDEATGKVIGDTLIAQGCDIIFVAAGASGNGVFTAAKEAGTLVIGCDVDQFDDGAYAGGNVVLTSVFKNMRINVTRSLVDIKGGTFRGGNYLLGADTDSTGYVSATGRHQMSEDTLEALADAFAKLKSGEIVPPGNFAPGNIERAQ